MEGDPAPRANALFVLGAGPAQLGLLEAARARDLFVVAVDRDPEALGFPLADRRALISAEDEPAIERLARSEPVDGLIAPGIDWPVGIAARIADRLGLPHPIDPQTASLATSKLKQRARFAERGVPQPRFEVVREPVADVGFPCVVKAPDRQGQRGLSVVTEPSDFDDAVRQAVAESRSGVALVEELVIGPEVTVNAFSIDGEFFPLTVTDRITADPPAFGVALAHVWPSEVAGDEAVEAARQAADALGIRNGPTYTQIRIGPEGPRVVELAARLGGGHDAELCALAVGVDLNALAIAAAPRRAGGRRRRPLPRRARGRAARGRGRRRRRRSGREGEGLPPPRSPVRAVADGRRPRGRRASGRREPGGGASDGRASRRCHTLRHRRCSGSPRDVTAS